MKLKIAILILFCFFIILFPLKEDLTPKTLETERLILKQLQKSDLQDVSKFMNDEIARNLAGNMKEPYKKNYVKQYKKQINKKKVYNFAIRTKEKEEFVGIISVYLFKSSSCILPGKVAYWAAENQRRKGYTEEALIEIQKLYPEFFGLNKVWTTVRADNPASSNLLKKHGFKQIGSRFSSEFPDKTEVLEYIFEKDLF